MKEGDEIVIDWPRVYAPSRGIIKSIKGKEAYIFCMGSTFAVPLDKLKKWQQ